MSTQKSERRKNLSRESWLLAALKALKEKGHQAIAVDSLAKQLGITRGSFYHHFENRDDLMKAMLSHWLTEWTLRVRDSVAILGLDPKSTLLALINTIRNREAAHYDAAVRAWALSDPLAAKYVRRADMIRLAYIKSVFEALGFEGLEAESRARMFLYYEAFEPMMFDPPNPADEDALIAHRHALLTAPEISN
jgi:AcrR family transcriptional regulator